MLFSDIDFFDINFYYSIPIWIYIIIGCLLIGCMILCCCINSSLKTRQNVLEKKELELEREKLNFERKMKKQKKEDNSDIILSRPSLYVEHV
jgi:cell division protein FtsL